jgi:hypothetical protein
MVMKKKIYIAGPRMGQNNSAYGIEAKPAKSSKTKNKAKKKK